jgi:RecA-family ATPase
MPIARRPASTGNILREELKHCEEMPPFLVNDLFVKDASFMLAGHGQCGKSSLTLCAVAAMTAGLPVWGQFVCPRPLKVYWVCGERTAREPKIRLKRMSFKVPFEADRLWISDAFASTIDLTRPEQADEMIAVIKRDCPELDVLVLDPLYSLVAGGLSEDRVASAVCRSFTQLKTTLGCSLWITHHNVKSRLNEKGEETNVKNPLYGSVHLYNHVEAQYTVTRQGKDQSVLTLQKDSHTLLFNTIPLAFDFESYTAEMVGDALPLLIREKAILYCRQKQESQVPFTFAEIHGATGVSRSEFFRLDGTPPLKGLIVNVKPAGVTASYVVKK